MKKNFLTAVAITVVAFFVATEIAIASDISFSGSFRSRFESSGDNDFTNATDNDDAIATQVRLNTTVNINESTSAFIQMQSARVWGENIHGVAGNAGSNAGGSGNASFSASNGDGSVGLHQAYFTLKNFATLPADLKLGRQQVVLDGHRLFGHTGWTTGAQTHDAIRLTHKGGDHTLSYVYILANDSGDAVGAGVGFDEGDLLDVDVHVLHANFQGILGGGLSVYFVATIDGCGNGTGAVGVTNCDANLASNNIYTVGFRQAGQLFGLNYRGEYYHQFGDARADANLASGTMEFDQSALVAPSIDRDAYMFGLRIGKKFNNVKLKPSLTIWYDQLSGTDDSDIAGDQYSTFNTLFDTGHKFYGHMDLFLNARNHGTAGLGLTDFAIKGSIQPSPGWTLKVAWHQFQTDTDPISNPNSVGAQVAATVDEDIGQEIDVQLIHKYNANTVISAGYSAFGGEQLFVSQRATAARPGDGGSADWTYVQFHVKF